MQYRRDSAIAWIFPQVNSKDGDFFAMLFTLAGKPENSRFCVAEGSNQSSLFELRPDKVKNYDFTLRRLDSEALRLLQR